MAPATGLGHLEVEFAGQRPRYHILNPWGHGCGFGVDEEQRAHVITIAIPGTLGWVLALAHPLTAAALVEVLEGGALLGLGAYAGLAAFGETQHAGLVPAAAGLAALTGLLGIGAVIAGIALHRARRWARAPAVLTQVLAIPVGISLAQGGQPRFGVPLVIVAAGGLVLLLHPATTRKLVGP